MSSKELKITLMVNYMLLEWDCNDIIGRDINKKKKQRVDKTWEMIRKKLGKITLIDLVRLRILRCYNECEMRNNVMKLSWKYTKAES